MTFTYLTFVPETGALLLYVPVEYGLQMAAYDT